jgi:hypothetical protein
VAAKLQTSETGLTYLLREEEGALVRTAVEEAEDVGMLEFGDDLHFAFELLDFPGVRLGAGEQEFHRHRVAAGFRGGEIDGTATVAAGFAGDGVVAEKTRGETPLRRSGARRPSH